MSGTRLRNTDLNAHSGNSGGSARAFRAWVTNTVIASSIIGGVAMAQPAFTAEKPARQGDKETLDLQSKTLTLQNQFNAQYVAASRYAKQRELHLPTGYVDEAAANAKIKAPLIETALKINSTFRIYNAGKDFIEIPQGSAYMTQAALDRINSQAKLAFDSIDFAAQLVGAAIDTTAHKPAVATPVAKPDIVITQPVIPQPIAVRDTMKTVPAQAAQPISVPPVSAISEEVTGYKRIYDPIAQDFYKIAGTTASGVTNKTKAEAKTHGDAITTQLVALDRATTAAEVSKAVEKLNAQKKVHDQQKYSDASRAANEAAIVASAVQAGIPIGTARGSPILRELIDLNTLLDGISRNAQTLSDQKKAAEIVRGANLIRDMLSKVLLLSEDEAVPPTPGATTGLKLSPRWDAYLQGFRPAAIALNNGDVEGAKRLFNYGYEIFQRDQGLNMQRLGLAKDMVDWTVATIKNSRLPTATQLQDQEKAMGIRTVAQGATAKARNADAQQIEDRRYYHSFSNGTDNSRESLLAIMANRQQQINNLMTMHAGKVSASQVSDLQQTVEIESRAMTRLISMWNYILENGLDKADKSTKYSAWMGYATATRILAYPNREIAINPYASYPNEMQEFIVSQYRNATGDNKMSKEKIIEALMRNPERMYEDALYGLYQMAYVFAPAVKGPTETAVNALAGLNSALAMWDYDYPQYDNLTEQTVQVFGARVDDARYYVQTAVELLKASNAQGNDVLFTAAKTWLAQPVPSDSDGKAAYADALWSMAMDMASIRAAEVWLLNSDLIGRSDLTREQLYNAAGIIKAARNRFEHLYAVPEAGPMNYYSYPDLPRNIANDAIRLLAPAAFSTTEIHAAYEVCFQSQNAKEHVKKVDIGGGSFNDMRAAQLQDREAAIAAANDAEAGHLRMLVSLRGAADFGSPVISASDSQLMAGYRLLNPDVGRKPFPPEEITRPMPTITKADLHVDDQGRLHEATEEYHQGAQWGEVKRQRILLDDKAVPDLLRQHSDRADTFETTIRNISMSYGGQGVSTQIQLTAINRGYMQILDAKIADLEARLSGSVEVVVDSQKQMVPVRQFATSSHPKAVLVRNAIADLDEVKAFRQQYQQKIGQNLFDGSMPMTPKQSILTMEQALASLTDKNLPPYPGPAEENIYKGVRFEVVDIKKSHPDQRLSVPGVGYRLWSFYEADARALSKEAGVPRSETFEQFQARTGEEPNVVYRWMFTSELRKDYILVCNPHLYEKGHENDAPFKAIIMKDKPQAWSDGTTVYPVVRALPPEKATGKAGSFSTVLDYVPVYNNGAPDVLCHVRDDDVNLGSYVTVERNRTLSDEVKDLMFKYGGKDMDQVTATGMTASVRVLRSR